MTKDLSHEIQLLLMSGSMHVNQLQRNFPNNRNDFFRIYKEMVRDGILYPVKNGNRIILSIRRPEVAFPFDMVMSSLPLAEEKAEKYMKKLRQSRPIFRDTFVADGKKVPFKISSINKKTLDKILGIINDLVSRSVALTYAECLDLLPANSLGLVRKYHKQCIETIRKIMNKLENEHENPKSGVGMSAYLYYGVNGFGHLTNLEFLHKKYTNR